MNLKNLLSRFSYSLVLFFICNSAIAQNKTISGTVTDSKDKQPLIGVSVAVKGTPTGTSTGADGTYRLTVPEATTTLVFSYLGYNSQDVNIAGSTTVNVLLEGSSTSLSEVVVVGYGTQRVKDATGAVASIGTKDFNKGVIASPEQLLQGRVAGVQVTPSSGEPGAGINIRIRGSSSVRSGSNPLFVVDGVPLDGSNVSDGGGDNGAGSSSARNPLTFLNPDDIENISVLKDASSAAIYGSRGANGVVLITTKKGKSGQQSLNFSSSVSVANSLRTYDLLSPSAFIAKSVELGKTAASVNFGANTNWQDQIFRTGVTQNYSLGFGGGNENTLYRFSLSNANQEGIVRNSGLNRSTGRVNASHELFDKKVKIELQLTASQLNDQYAPVGENAGFEGNLIGAALAANPTRPIFINNSDTLTQSSDFRNPVAMLNYINDRGITNKVLGNMSLGWKITDGLLFKVNVGVDNSASNRRSTFNSMLKFNGIENSGRAILANRTLSSRLIENTLTFNKSFNTIHSLEALAGFSYQKFESDGFNTRADGFLNNLITYEDNIGNVDNSGTKKAFSSGSYRSGSELQSYFGRANYSLMDKYLLTATLRVDGSSKFGPNNKYGYFPSVAGAWRISEESFVSKDVFQNLKLRAGWGINGNQEFPGGITNATYNYSTTGAISKINNQNPDIRWEKSNQYSVGLDFEILKSRLSGSFDYYNKSTTDLIFLQSIAQPAPALFIWKNLPATVNNTGLEASISYSVFRNEGFTWDIGVNAASLTNKVKDLQLSAIRTGAINGQGLSGAYAQRIVSGYPLFSFFIKEFAGFDNAGAATFANDGAEEFRGSALPKFTFGLNNSFTYKNLSLSAFLNGATGFYIYNNTATALFSKGSLNSGRNITQDAANTAEGKSNSTSVSTQYLEKGDFLRLSNLNLAYTFKLPNTKHIKGFTMNLTGQNLFLITNYSGLDPEVNTNKAIDGIPSLGIDYTSYPSARVISLGASLNF
ncbi:MAG: SusC/RagA family TonB-linked outer membrane protein [Flavobacterium sp.]|nr:SusC/RagA family TonB-linked outer membrane protein [Pedobacter sp.]